MQIDLTALPDDSTVLHSMIRDVVAATLQRDAQVTELTAENDKLRALIQKLLRHRFGRRSEQLSPDQLQLAMEEIAQEIAGHEADEDAAAESEETRRQRRAARPQRNLGALPAHLPRHEVVIDIDSKVCPCCNGTLHQIGETRTEMLDIVPAQLKVNVIRRPRYACRACEECVVQMPAPDRPIDGGMPTEALLATAIAHPLETSSHRQDVRTTTTAGVVRAHPTTPVRIRSGRVDKDVLGRRWLGDGWGQQPQAAACSERPWANHHFRRSIAAGTDSAD